MKGHQKNPLGKNGLDKAILNGFVEPLNHPHADHRQLVDFFYSQLIDAFVYFKARKSFSRERLLHENKALEDFTSRFVLSDYNAALLAQQGSDQNGLRGISFSEYFGNQYQANYSALDLLMRSGEVFSELTIEKKDGSVLWIEGHYQCIKADNGFVTGILGVQRDVSQRKLAFKAHAEIEERLQKLVQLSFEGIVILRQGIIQDVNNAVLKLTGYNRDEILRGRKMSKCLPSSIYRKIFKEKWKESSESIEAALLRKDGSSIVVEIEMQTLSYGDEPVNVIAIRDISNRRRIEEEIVKLSIALDQSANIVIITKKNGDIEYVNHSFSNVTGYSPAEVIGRNPRILKSGTHSSAFYRKLWKTLLRGQQWKGEFHNRKKSGTLYWELATITPIKNKEGEVVRFIAIKEDITLRKNAEQSLRESEEKYRSLVSNIPGVVYRCAFDDNLTIFYITDAIETLTGYHPDHFVQSKSVSLKEIIHPEDLERVMEDLRNEIGHGRHFALEYRIITRAGATKWISNTGRPIYDENRSVLWLDGFIRDITDRVLALEELRTAKIAAEEANKAKSEFLANISHEIRTPLNSVLGFTELLEGLTTDPVQVKYLNSIKASGKNLMMLINDLLDLSKIEAGKMTLYYTFFDIRKLLDEIRNVFSLRVSIKGIVYTEFIEAGFPAEIRFDETRLRQILINLVGNAVKFTHEGEISITVRHSFKKSNKKQPSMRLEITIVDTGIGIPENSFRLIFEAFRQQSQVDSKKYGGTGLGLAITKRLVEAMNGKIMLESEVGKGSVFTIIFPSVEYSVFPSVAHRPVKIFSKKSRDERKPAHTSERGLKGTTAEPMMPEVQASDHSDLHELADIFDNELKKKWRHFESKQPLKEIQHFAHEIVILGNRYKMDFITNYGEQLLSTIENFDIEEMRMKLDFFPELLNQLKKKLI
jgi:two-component system sensor histidine kinase/response regulator